MSAVSPDAPQGGSGAQWVASFAIDLKLENSHSESWPAGGNSDSDMQMIEYTMAGEGRRLGLLVHHTDAAREFVYDRKSHVGTLDKALDQAHAMGWITWI